jgi:anthranilate synthase component 1
MSTYQFGQTVPTFEEFKKYAQNRKVIPVARRIRSESFSPVGLYRALAQEKPGTFLLESAEHGQSWSRYSFIGVSSSACLRSENAQARWSGNPPKGVKLTGPIWEVFQQTLDFLATEPLPDLPPLTGGLVGYLAYDIVRIFEKIPANNPDETNVPDLVMLLATDFAVLDHVDASVWLIANAVNYDGTDERVDEAYQDAISRLDVMENLLKSARNEVDSSFDQNTKVEYQSRTTKDEYQNSVNKAIKYIEAGDAFQIVVSQRFQMPSQASGLDIYRVLRSTNPSPYMYYLKIPSVDNQKTDFEIIGSSPEALVTIKDRKALMHPIAGTRPRSSDTKTDELIAQELLNDPKEKAEHLMLVDLGRNDLGRISKPGSVEVTQFMQVEKYSHVMHLVSTVTSELRDEVSGLDVLRATFPAGTLSGAPKVRAMEIIDELEPVKRGIYGGALGYFDFAGNLDVAITIRTALLKDSMAFVQAGAGVVADSNPEMEHLECQNKAAVVLKAIAIANSLG